MTDSKELQPTAGPPITATPNEIEARATQIFEDEQISERIKAQMQVVIREELSKMSTTLRDAIRDWVIREKEKARMAPQDGQVKLLDRKVEELTEENSKLSRQVELQQHENKMIMQGLNQLLKKRKKK